MTFAHELLANYLVTGVVSLCVGMWLVMVLKYEDSRRPDAWWTNLSFSYFVVGPLIAVSIGAGGLGAVVGLVNFANQPISAQGIAVMAAAIIVLGVTRALLRRNPEPSPRTAEPAYCSPACQ